MIKMYGMYLRKSRSDDASESIDVTLRKHKKILFDLAKKLKIPREQILIFKEVVSGENIKNRPEMQKLLEYVMNGIFEGVLVVDAQRLARGDTLDQGTIERAFSINNTKIITPLKTIDPANEYDQDYFEFDMFMGRREYKMINRRMQRGRVLSVMDGYYVGSIPPYGYKKVKLDKGYSLEIVDHEAVIVKKIFNLAASGVGTTNIAKELNSSGIKTRKSDRWTPSIIRTILKNITYCGYIKWNERKSVMIYRNGDIVKTRPLNKKFNMYPGKHPALISMEIYNKVQENMKLNSNDRVPKEKKLKNPLSGIIICKRCGRKMVRRPYKNGRIETIICNTVGCHNVSSDLNILENRIIDEIKKELSQNKKFLDNYDIEQKQYDLDKKDIIKECDEQIEKLHQQLDKACEMLELGAYTIDLFKTRKDHINKQLNELTERKNKLIDEDKESKLVQTKNLIPKLEKCIELYHVANNEEKNIILKSVIDKIIYNKEKSGRWDQDAINNFDLEIYYKNQ